MLEKMSAFFENRLDGYDEHMMTDIESADEILHHWGATYTLKAKR